jgi:hypothetical protein
MKVMSYVELTAAQIRTIDDLEKVVVTLSIASSSPRESVVMATITTFQQQKINLIIDTFGIVRSISIDG